MSGTCAANNNSNILSQWWTHLGLTHQSMLIIWFFEISAPCLVVYNAVTLGLFNSVTTKSKKEQEWISPSSNNFREAWHKGMRNPSTWISLAWHCHAWWLDVTLGLIIGRTAETNKEGTENFSPSLGNFWTAVCSAFGLSQDVAQSYLWIVPARHHARIVDYQQAKLGRE